MFDKFFIVLVFCFGIFVLGGIGYMGIDYENKRDEACKDKPVKTIVMVYGKTVTCTGN